MKQPTAWTGFILLVVSFVGLSVLYQRATPPFEASDEGAHVGMVVCLHELGHLPVLKPGHKVPFLNQEMTQPPLYYAWCALMLRGRDLSDTVDGLITRPDNPAGRADRPGYKNMWIPRWDRLSRLHGILRAVHDLRWWSALMGLGTVLLTWRMARTWWPEDPGAALLAACWVAFNPMFLFITNSVNNDNLVILLSTLTLWWLQRMARQPLDVGRVLVAGLLIGLAVLTKTSGLILCPLAVWALLARRDIRWRLRVRGLALMGLATFVVCGWWFIRNHVLYQDGMAFRLHVFLIGNGRTACDPWALLREWDGFIKSYWGVFGGFNVIYPDCAYRFFFGLTALAVVAVLLHLFRHRKTIGAWPWLLVVYSVLNVLGVAYWTSRLLGSQGRLLFPSIAAHALLWVMSLRQGGNLARAGLLAVALMLLALAVVGAVQVIPPAYPP